MSNFDSNWLRNYELRNAPPRRQPVASEPDELEGDLHAKIISECRRRVWMPVRSRMDRATTTMPGVCDFIIYADKGRIFHIECKGEIGKLSEDQRIFIAWAEKLGHKVVVVRSFSEFLEAVK